MSERQAIPVPIPPRFDAEARVAIVARFLVGESVASIAESLKVGHLTIEQVIRRHPGLHSGGMV